MKKLVAISLGVTIAGGLMAGCGSTSPSGSSTSSAATNKAAATEGSTSSTSSTSEAVTANSVSGSNGDYTVGLTLNLGNLTWAELAEAAKAHGEELGMTVTVQNSNDDATTQVSQIENFIQSKVDAIIVAAVESNSVEDVCKKAQDAGIKVIAYTQVIENSDAEYLVDAYNTGYACGERAAEWINEVYPDQEVEWALEDLPKYH